jgi:Flp pilus assembly protein TadB
VRNEEEVIKKAKNTNLLNSISDLFKKANLPISSREFVLLIFIIFSAELLISVYFSFPVLLIVFIFFSTVLVIYFVINSFSLYIIHKKEGQLGSFLIDLTGNLYANPNIMVSIKKTIGKTEPPLKHDLQLIVDDCAKGLLLKDALKNMISRNKSNLIEIIIMGIIAANEKGADIVLFLTYQAEYLREKKSINNYIKILSTGPKYTSYFIMLIPLASIIIILLLNKNFINLYLSGFFLINKIINNLNQGTVSI